MSDDGAGDSGTSVFRTDFPRGEPTVTVPADMLPAYSATPYAERATFADDGRVEDPLRADGAAAFTEAAGSELTHGFNEVVDRLDAADFNDAAPPKTAKATHCVAVVARCECGATTVQEDPRLLIAALNGSSFAYGCGKCQARAVSTPRLDWVPPQPRAMPNRAQRRAEAAQRGKIIMPGGR